MSKNPSKLTDLSAATVFKHHRYSRAQSETTYTSFSTNIKRLLTDDELKEIATKLQTHLEPYLHDSSYKAGDDVIDFLLNKPEKGLYYAALYGSEALYDLSKQALQSQPKSVLDRYLQIAFRFAMKSGYVKMFEICRTDLVQRALNFNITMMNDCVDIAFLDRLELIQYISKNYALSWDLYKRMLIGSAKGRSNRTFNFVFDTLLRKNKQFRNAPDYPVMVNTFVQSLNNIMDLKTPLDDVIMNKIIQIDGIDVNAGLKQAVRMNDLKWVKYFIRKGANDYNQALVTAVESDNHIMYDFFINRGADSFLDALNAAAVSCNYTFIQPILDTFDNKAENANIAMTNVIESNALYDLIKLETVLRILISNDADINIGMIESARRFKYDILEILMKIANITIKQLILDALHATGDNEQIVRLWLAAAQSYYMSHMDYSDIFLDYHKLL